MSEGATGGTIATSSSDPLEWQFLQCFGERTPGEEIQEGQQPHLLHYKQQNPLKATCGIESNRGPPVCLLLLACTQSAKAFQCIRVMSRQVEQVPLLMQLISFLP